jgi:Phage tail assembly chaperone protein
MANYAYVENNSITQLRDELPENWKNVSNFFVLSDIEAQNYGWYKLTKVIPDYNPNTQYPDTPTYSFVDGVAYENYNIVNIPQPTPPVEYTVEQLEQIAQQNLIEQWNNIRAIRDKLMNDFQWRYSRYDRQVRLNITPTDDLLLMDNYMQALADITTQTDPYNIVWPEYVG